MHRFSIVVLAAFLAASCDRFPDSSIQIGGMLPFEDDCTVDPEADLRRPFGIWDVNAPTDTFLEGYFVTPRFESYIISRATEIQAQQNNLQVTNLEITLQTPDGVRLELGAGLPNPYRTQATSNLPVAEEDGFSTGTTISVGIPLPYRDAVAQAVQAANFDQVIVVIQAVATTIGGFTQTSGPFFWPVTICNGCLDACATPADGLALSDEQLDLLTGSCLPGQDGFLYCTNPPPPTMTP